MSLSETDYRELLCQARGTDRHGAPVEVPSDLRVAAARRLVEDGVVSPDQLEGLPLDDLFNLVGHPQRQRGDRDWSGGDRLPDGRRLGRRS